MMIVGSRAAAIRAFAQAGGGDAWLLTLTEYRPKLPGGLPAY